MAVALERNPEVARAIVERGHEVCGHGYRWQEYHSMDRDSELDSIRKTVESLERTTGVRPVGGLLVMDQVLTLENWLQEKRVSFMTVVL
ncbi:MAG: hypothetical protein CM1200mP15_12740 [Dehalococcoidia bacterium]|nr:MAG: hypothetical protein CM1200mP15_12740 [Dehalococcoidia bacterium]